MPKLTRKQIATLARDEEIRQQEILAGQRRKIVDEFAVLDSEISAVKTKLGRLADLGKLIRGWFSDAVPETTYTATGDRFEVIVGAAGLQTHMVSTAELYRVMGHDKFLKASQMTLKALESNLDSALVASLIEKKRTGSRTLTPRRIAA